VITKGNEKTQCNTSLRPGYSNKKLMQRKPNEGEIYSLFKQAAFNSINDDSLTCDSHHSDIKINQY
jgi:hypothetical protein